MLRWSAIITRLFDCQQSVHLKQVKRRAGRSHWGACSGAQLGAPPCCPAMPSAGAPWKNSRIFPQGGVHADAVHGGITRSPKGKGDPGKCTEMESSLTEAGTTRVFVAGNQSNNRLTQRVPRACSKKCHSSFRRFKKISHLRFHGLVEFYHVSLRG